MRPNQEFIQLLQPKYQNSPPPTPSYWAHPSMGVGFEIDKAGNYIGYTVSYAFTPIYQTGTNSLMVGGFNVNAVAASTSGSYNVSIFFVAKGSPYLSYTYDNNWSDTGSGGGGNYNFGQVSIWGDKVTSSWRYTGTYPSEVTQYSSVKMASTSTFSIYSITANMDSTPTVSCRINGVAQGTTSSNVVPTIPSNPSPYLSLFKYQTTENIGDVIIYNSILSAGDILLVEEYLRTKWGL